VFSGNEADVKSKVQSIGNSLKDRRGGPFIVSVFESCDGGLLGADTFGELRLGQPGFGASIGDKTCEVDVDRLFPYQIAKLRIVSGDAVEDP